MKNVPNVIKSSMRGICLSVILISSIAMLIIIPSNVYAVSVTSVSLEETTVIKLVNDSEEDINTVRVWLDAGTVFKSFKTEDGWTGQKTIQGIVVFTASESIKPGDSVKFGVKTDTSNPAINWNALNDSDEELGTGKVVSKELAAIPTIEPDPVEQPIIVEEPEAMTSDSTFRIIPDKPSAGSSFRVTGEKFGPSENFDFYIDEKKLGSFTTDQEGHFMTTMKVPDDQPVDRADFIIKNGDGNEMSISLRMTESIDRETDQDSIKLTIQGVPEIIYRGDFLEIFGTGKPGSAITGEIIGPGGEIINSRTAEINDSGDWKLEPIIMALDTPFGEYSATITDGREDILKKWKVESNKIILITPSSIQFKPGETMIFNGTALADTPIEFIIEDPLGKEIFSDIKEVNATGFVQLEYPTTQGTLEGTYTVIAKQGDDKEFIFAGLGELPSIPIKLEFGQLNYRAGDLAEITLVGKALEVVSLLILDPSDKPKDEARSITLLENGRGEFFLDLTGYGSGAYTAIASKGSSKSSAIFTVGLELGSGEIKITTTKTIYEPGEPILILGDTNPSVLLTIKLTDPQGHDVKIKETFSDKEGKISESSFRIPSGAEPGTWNINAKSGSTFHNIEIEVSAVTAEGMVVSAEREGIKGFRDVIQIRVAGASQSVEIEIVDAEGELVGKKLKTIIKKDGKTKLPWAIPDGINPGVYTIKVKDAVNSANATFTIQ